MLKHLHIENLAVIERVDLDLGSGFSVLTGETGAGKSVLIHSINLLLGDRVGKDMVRSGCSKAVVSGLFTDLPEGMIHALAEQGFDGEDEVLIQRELACDGRSSVRINGRPATVSMLRGIADGLVNIHGQHDNRALLDPSTHVSYLDAFAKNHELRARYETVFFDLKQVLRRISEISTDEQTRMQKIDLLSYQVSEIDGAALSPGEDEALSQRRSVLANAEKIQSNLASAYALCSEENSARDKLCRAALELESVSGYNTSLSRLSDRMVSLCDELNDITAELRDCLENSSVDPFALNEVEERLDLIYRLKRKYGPTIEDILSFRKKSAEELELLQSASQRADELNAEKERLYELLKSAASELTDSRNRAAKILEKELTEQLAFLDMPNTGFFVQIDFAGSYTPSGADSVEFLLSANLGESLRPLSKIASGGELSRIMLCMKTILTLEEDAQTLIFDEVDTGVSGKAAEKIAKKLKEISFGKQVIVITHLAQIAAYGDEHFLIEKAVADNRTFTSVYVLDRSSRIKELARIMGGSTPTSATLAAAEDLLSYGAGYKKA